MNIRALARVILEAKLDPDFPIFAQDSEGRRTPVIAFEFRPIVAPIEGRALLLHIGKPSPLSQSVNASDSK